MEVLAWLSACLGSGLRPSQPHTPATHPPHPSSQSFSQSYGSILPTSLTYIVPSTRGCTPWRPAAVIGTTGRGIEIPWIFTDHRERSRRGGCRPALPAGSCFASQTDSTTHPTVNKKRKLFPEPPLASPGSFASPPSPPTCSGILTRFPFAVQDQTSRSQS